jgi:phytoene desaturase
MRQQAVVVGAGFGGLAAACRLRARGYDVTIVESQDQLGGRAGVFRRDGFIFDAGPTVITAHVLLDELFALFGKRREDYFRLVPVEPWYRLVFADGSHFDYGGTVDQMLEQIRAIEPRDAKGYLRLLARSKKIFDVGFVQKGDQPFDTRWSMLRMVPRLAWLGAWRSVWAMTCKYIRNEKLRRAFSFAPLLIGGNPLDTPAIYLLIQHLERQWGVHYCLGGTGAVVAALAKLLDEQGVTIRLSAPVEEILVEPGGGQRSRVNITGVRLVSGELLRADIVVCNADAPAVYKHLLPPPAPPARRGKWTDRRIERLKFSMGLFVLYFGTSKIYPDVKHHTVLFGQQYKRLLRDIFDRRTLATRDLSLYLHRPTCTDPGMAPPGCDAFYVLCPVPNLLAGVNWQTMGPRYRDLVLQELEDRLLPEVRKNLVTSFYLTPEHFRDNLGSLHGSGFSIQPTLRQSAYWRFHNRSPDVEGLYFVGAGTHPGAGIPGVLCSAKVLEHVLPPMPAATDPSARPAVEVKLGPAVDGLAATEPVSEPVAERASAPGAVDAVQ